MSRKIHDHPPRQTGFVLIASLLLLLVVTIMAMSMFRGYGIQDKIAANLREKQRAFHAADLAEQFAEFWLTSGTNASLAPVNCTAELNALLNEGQICSNALAAPTSVPSGWQVNGADVGVTYVPPIPQGQGPQMDVNQVAAAGTYYDSPRFYIADLGPGANGEVYQIDALGYGATTNSVAVVESTYLVGSQVINRGGP